MDRSFKRLCRDIVTSKKLQSIKFASSYALTVEQAQSVFESVATSAVRTLIVEGPGEMKSPSSWESIGMLMERFSLLVLFVIVVTSIVGEAFVALLKSDSLRTLELASPDHSSRVGFWPALVKALRHANKLTSLRTFRCHTLSSELLESLLRNVRHCDALEEFVLVDCFEELLSEHLAKAFAKYFETTTKLAKFKLKVTHLVIRKHAFFVHGCRVLAVQSSCRGCRGFVADLWKPTSEPPSVWHPMIVAMQQCRSLRDVTLGYYGNTAYVPTWLPRSSNQAVIDLLRHHQLLHSLDVPIRLEQESEILQFFDAVLQHSLHLVSVVGVQMPHLPSQQAEAAFLDFVANNRLEQLSIGERCRNALRWHFRLS